MRWRRPTPCTCSGSCMTARKSAMRNSIRLLAPSRPMISPPLFIRRELRALPREPCSLMATWRRTLPIHFPDLIFVAARSVFRFFLCRTLRRGTSISPCSPAESRWLMFPFSINFRRLCWRFVLRFSWACRGCMKRFTRKWISRRKAFPRNGSIAGRCRSDGLTGRDSR